MFKLVSSFKPSGDQPQAIEKLTEGILKGYRFQTLLGVTGSGKTFTMANVIKNVQRPTLVISPNKALAAQLYREFKEFFPENRVEFFISYYDYYQPEAYLPEKDVYIEKDADINAVLQRMRLSTLKSVLTRKDVIVVASVSCIYPTGSPEDYQGLRITLEAGQRYDRTRLFRDLVAILYSRAESKEPGTFRAHGEVIEVFPPYDEEGIRLEFFDDELESISAFDPLTGRVIDRYDRVVIYPANEFVTTREKIERACRSIEQELEERLRELKDAGKLLEAQRLEMRTRQDMELLKEMGHCPGIENYSRHFEGRAPGEPPWTLFDYFGDDLLIFIDESHITLPQLAAMYRGDHSRKKNLVEYGFRLPSAYDNRPLRYEEVMDRIKQAIFVSATPGDTELRLSSQVVEQLIRPTGLVDPEVVVKPTEHQVDDLIEELGKVRTRNERALVVVLTKKMAEDLSEYLKELGFRAAYMHSELNAIERVDVLKKLRSGEIEVVVGVNLLREGLDLPEVSLVAIMDADVEGFLRSETTLIQTIGRAARNLNGRVVLYADRITGSMKRAIDETNRRRKLQMEYNEKHGIKPETIRKSLETMDIFAAFKEEEVEEEIKASKYVKSILTLKDSLSLEEYDAILEEEMYRAASELRYEDAAMLRDELFKIRSKKAEKIK
ncbi:MAG: excinuclease subunit [Thermotogota bacterium]|nr:excinuclease subunit [Thermotogota bacterium]MDK2863994.1 excinuclease subunit [Thermotogota bacterium]HCZ06543.1 excinuclease ABC subunit B [Thermotogota bacterium]